MKKKILSLCMVVTLAAVQLPAIVQAAEFANGDVVWEETFEAKAVGADVMEDTEHWAKSEIRGTNNDMYDYSAKVATNTVENTGYMDADFKMILYGPVVNPMVDIDGNIYQIIADVKENEYIVIDSLEHYVEQVDVVGVSTNRYNSRNKEWNIFQKIKPGISNIVWPGDFGVDLILYVKRSEPKWNS